MKRILISGFAGFIGINTFKYFAEKNYQVFGIDDLSRKGSDLNLKKLIKLYGIEKDKNYFIEDITNYSMVKQIVGYVQPDIFIHLAAQTAVTTSVTDPYSDMRTNIIGTFHILEAVRRNAPDCLVIYSSTNKVYGNLENQDMMVGENGNYKFKYTSSINEGQLLDFHSPYGCSKGAADQYVRDYARIYGMKTVVFRQSCIYGYDQNGSEDQGWISWLTLKAIKDEPINVYGSGCQVRDILFVTDLVRAYEKTFEKINQYQGKIYNIGGGTENTLSVNDLLVYLKRAVGRPLNVAYHAWRPGDQKVYISDITKVRKELKWNPEIDKNKGLDLMYNWTRDNVYVL